MVLPTPQVRAVAGRGDTIHAMRWFASFLAGLVLGCATTASPAQRAPASAAGGTRYIVTIAGNPAGYQTVTTEPDSSLHIHFEFKGFAVHRVLEQYVEAGIPAPEVLSGRGGGG